VQKRTRLARLAGALPVELAGHMRGVLVVGGAARAAKVSARIRASMAMAVSVRHAPARHRHGPVRIPAPIRVAGHGAVGGVVSQIALGAARNLGLQLVGKGPVLQMRWWGSLVVVGRVGGEVSVGGSKRRHGSSAAVRGRGTSRGQ
jgi:hypothetical protein